MFGEIIYVTARTPRSPSHSTAKKLESCVDFRKVRCDADAQNDDEKVNKVPREGERHVHVFSPQNPHRIDREGVVNMPQMGRCEIVEHAVDFPIAEFDLNHSVIEKRCPDQGMLQKR